MSRIILVVMGLALLISCNVQPDTADLVRYMAVQTRYDQGVITDDVNIFTTYTNFIIREDTIGFVSNTSNDTILVDGDNIDVPGGYVTPVIDKVKENLAEAGFIQVDEEGDPDFAVNIVVLQNFSYYQAINYPGYYPGGYFGYYGYYYPIVTTYSSNYATLIIEIVDIANFAANGNKYRVVWTASMGDLITTDDLRGKSLEAIDQAFIQSSYINKN
jgi:hypothetical protein